MRGRGHAQLSRLTEQVVRAAMLCCDSRRCQAGGMLCERGLPAVVPPEPVQKRFRNRKYQAVLILSRERWETGRSPNHARVRRRGDERRRGKRGLQ
jgi:hypothetical protein